MASLNDVHFGAQAIGTKSEHGLSLEPFCRRASIQCHLYSLNVFHNGKIKIYF